MPLPANGFRLLWRALGGAALLALAAGFAIALPHPASPWALTWADASFAAGDALGAVARYAAVAARHPSADVRHEAHRRAALLLATQLQAPSEARRHLEATLVDARGDARAAVLEQLAELLVDEGSAEGAAARLEEAAAASSDPVVAGRRRLRAAEVLASDGRDKPADAIYRRVIRDVPALLAEAELGRGRLKLRQGRTEQALTAFERAAGHTWDPDIGSAARLGRTVCLERLGDLDQALAELEQVDGLPDAIRDDRAGFIEGRRSR